MKLRVDVMPEAAEALEARTAWLSERSADDALRFHDDVFNHLDLVALGLLEGPEHRLPSGELARRLVVPPLLIFYQREADAIRVVFVHDARQRPFDR